MAEGSLKEDNDCRGFSHLLHPVRVKELVQSWLKEDTSCFDYGGFVVGNAAESAVLLCKSPGVLCGSPFFDAIFNELNCDVKWLEPEGKFLDPCQNSNTPITVAKITGQVRNLLLGERVSLNCLTRASGVATKSRRLLEVANRAGWKGQVAGTRKTTPGFRMVEKYGLLVGGVSTHRYDLSSMIMLKDNHIWSAGNITQAVQDAKQVAGFSTMIEVECRSVDEAREAASAGAHVVMLDNFSPSAAFEASGIIKSEFPHALIEVSGGITEERFPEFLAPDVDVISLSCLTQGYSVVDFSFKILKHGRNPCNPTVTNLLVTK